MRFNILTLLFIILLVSSCTAENQFDEKKETNEILKLHNLQRDYHFNRDSIAFANQLSDNFISVNKGKITRPSRQETISRYHSYFSSVEFIKWDDVTEPIIIFSEDGSIAYTIVDKIVQTTYENESGNKESGETHFAWTAIYKKYKDGWKVDCVTSTQK